VVEEDPLIAVRGEESDQFIGSGQRFTMTVYPGQTAMVHCDWYPDKNEVQCEDLMQVG
jgi:hypothetical protein